MINAKGSLSDCGMYSLRSQRYFGIKQVHLHLLDFV